MLLFIGDVSDEKGWRSVHLDVPSGSIIECDQEGREVDCREPSQKELLIAVAEWAKARQDVPFPTTLYSAINKAL